MCSHSFKTSTFFICELEFNDISTRTDKKMYNKLTPIRMIFDRFVQRYQDVYTVGENCTIDKMLEAFRSRYYSLVYAEQAK